MSALESLGIKVTNHEGANSAAQSQTTDTFGYKWQRRETYDSPTMRRLMREWLLDKYCDGRPEKLAEWLDEGSRRKIILDAGCGAALSALELFGEQLKNHDYLGVDISEAVWVAKKRFEEEGLPGDFLQSDLMNLPVPDGSVDVIFSEGVLHHTDSTEHAIKYLATKLKPGGIFMFYVYAKKGPVREFTDDHIRTHLQNLSNDEAWEAIMPLTRLGKALGELNLTVDVPEDIPYLGIKSGPQNLQRLFYWNVCKLYYRPELTLDEMNHINFDWYRPLNCQRQTPDQVLIWCGEAGLTMMNINIQEAGITVVAKRN